MRRVLAILFFLLLFPSLSLAELSATDAGQSMVSGGITQFLKSSVDGMYLSVDNNTAITNEFGTVRGALYTVITHVPDPYETQFVKDLYANYFYLALYFVILFILGEFINRNAARTKITENVFGNKDLSTAKYIGGIAVCFLALFANYIFMGALQITQVLSQFAMSTVLDSIAPSPENVILYIMMAVCDFVVAIFFIVRYFIIFLVAICCTLLAVLWVPETTRGFAMKTTANIIRILALQPVTIFITCVGILALKNLPTQLQPFGYIGLTALVILTCWYMLTGDFTFIKKGGKALVKVMMV